MSNKVNKQQLAKQLERLDKADLIEEICQLFSNFKVVQQHYQKQYGGKAARFQIVEDYRQQIEEEFYFKGDYPKNPKIKELKKITKSFIKELSHKEDVIDLLLYQVEQIVSLALEIPDISMSFLSTAESLYTNALLMIDEDMLHIEFYKRAYKVVTKTNNINWYFHNTVKNVFVEVYGNNTEQ